MDSTDLILPVEKRSEKHIFYRYVVRTEHVEKLRNLIRERNVSAERPVYLPLSRYPGISAACPRAEEAWQTSLSIPLYPALSDIEAEMVADSVFNSINEINKGD